MTAGPEGTPAAGAAIVAAWRALDERRAALIAFLVTLAAGLATMTPDLIGVFFDDAIYVLVGKAIAEGQGYVYPQLPDTPPAIHYPPVWPAVIALAWKLGPAFPDNLGLLKALNPFILAGAAAGGTIVLRRMFGLSVGVAMLTVLAATVSVPMHVLTNVLLSEPLFIALLFPTLWWAERLRAEGGTRVAVVAACLAGLLVLTRTIAGAYVAATVLALLWERRWRETALYSAVVLLLLAPWQYFVWKHSPGFPDELRGSYGPYLEWVANGYRDGGLPFLQQVVAKNVADTWRFVGAVLTPRLADGLVRPTAAALATLAALGGLAVALRRPATRILALGTLGYAAIVLVWPFQVDRFLWAVWPLALVLALDGLRAAVRALRGAGRPRLALATVGVATALALGHTVYNVRGFSRGWASSASRGMSEREAPVVRAVNREPRLRGMTIAAEAAPMVALYTGLRVVPVEMLLVEDHLRQKTVERRVEILEAIDRRFRPDAYVLKPSGPYLFALTRAQLDSTRRFVEIPTGDADVRIFPEAPR